MVEPGMPTQGDLLREIAPPGRHATIGDLEIAAGITDRVAFWERFRRIEPAGASLDAGTAELRRLIAERLAQVPPVWMVCGSRRARERLLAITGPLTGRNLAFSGHDINHRGIYPVPAHHADQALAVSGVRRLSISRVRHLRPCWGD